jgi:aspartyl aminopeptidase
MPKAKNELKETHDRLGYHIRAAHDRWTAADRTALEPFCLAYRKFLDAAKTERLAARAIEAAARKAGFQPLDAASDGGKVFLTDRGKTAALAVIGADPVENGVNLVVAHIDSPRLDLKQNPLYEEQRIAYWKTHYYGGVRKHQWVARPLALYGVAIRADGKTVEIAIGDGPDDPCFTILDLLPHLSANAQNGKKLVDAIPGEKLNVVVGGRPLGKPEDGKDRVKTQILKLLHEKYGLTEEDFVSAELEIVPAGPAREVGLDRAFIGGYGQDDRICAYTAMRALLDLGKRPARTAVALFMDKEEIGSVGNTGAGARFFQDFIGGLLARQGADSERAIRRAVAASQALSADVNAALDPDWAEVHDRRNAALLGGGICISKYTGSRGKSGGSDANAEFVGKIRRLFNEAGAPWQTGELGKVDEGGGGTVALFFAEQGMEVLDAGPALLAMHSPFELAHKDDAYSSYLAYKAFFEKA